MKVIDGNGYTALADVPAGTIVRSSQDNVLYLCGYSSQGKIVMVELSNGHATWKDPDFLVIAYPNAELRLQP